MQERDAKGNMVITKEEVHKETRPPPWQIDAWIQERRFPERWGRRVVDANIKSDAPPHILQVEFVEPEKRGVADEDSDD